MIASQVMTVEPLTARSSDTVGEALTRMLEHGFHHLPVTDEAGHLLGVVSERSLADAVLRDPAAKGTPLSTLMTPATVTAAPDTPVPVIVDRMLSGGLRSIPVVDHDADDAIVGVITHDDVLRVVYQGRAEAAAVPGAVIGPALGVRKVLVPLAGDELSHLALRLVAALFRDAELHVCQVLHVPTPMVPSAFIGRVDNRARIASTRATIERRIRAAGLELPKIGIRLGLPATEICEYAEDEGIELIVMPSRKRHTLKRVLLGSVAEGVVAHSHCPVLVLRGELPELWAQHVAVFRAGG